MSGNASFWRAVASLAATFILSGWAAFAPVGGKNPLRAACVALGDSFTFANGGLGLTNYWPTQLEIRTQTGVRGNLGCLNLGASGTGTGYGIGVANALIAPLRPVLGIIYYGNNDTNPSNICTVQASPAPTATTYTCDAGKGATLSAGAAVNVGVETTRVIQSVVGDAVTLTTPLSGAPSAGTTVLLDTQANIITMSSRLTALGYTKQIIGVNHYMNWTSGGDTVNTETGADVPAPRTYQRAAGVALGNSIGAVTADLYLCMRQRIINGQDIQGSFSWHVADHDAHLNNYGESIVAGCMLSAMPVAWYPLLQ